MSTSPIPVILDVDTGVDDAMAILFAVAHPGVDVRAITCVAGNTSLGQVVANTLSILDLAGAPDIPVAAGAIRPLIEQPRAASHVHGDGGLGGATLPPSSRSAVDEGAIALMHRTIMQSDAPITIVALAPQTNLALLLRAHPEVVPRIERILFMGGSASLGNATAVAEFNVWHDPEAAAIVLDSGVPTYMYGLDVFNNVWVDQAITERLRASDVPLEQVVGTLLDTRYPEENGEEGPYRGWIGDAGAVCALVDPEAVGTRVLPVRVELAGYSRGQTLVDRRFFAGEDTLHGTATAWSRTEVALTADFDRLAAVFLTTLGLD
jgi:pyrimidine-specific ribonucleoside hydrolase